MDLKSRVSISPLWTHTVHRQDERVGGLIDNSWPRVDDYVPGSVTIYYCCAYHACTCSVDYYNVCL